MPKRTGTERPDFIQNAYRVVREAAGQSPKTEPPAKNPAAVALGKLGGAKGGKARAKKLTSEALSEIGRKGARARWGTSRPTE